MAEPLSPADRVSAYVDGEMTRQEAAEFAAQIAREPALAQTVARYQAMRAGVAALGRETVVIALPGQPQRRLPIRAATVLAAGLAALAVGGLWWAQRDMLTATAIIATAQDADTAAMVAQFEATVAGGALPSSGPAPALPDSITDLMQANGLRQAAASNLALPSGGIATARDFVGTHRCHVGIFSRPAAAGTASGLKLTDDGRTLLADWAEGGTEFTLISRSMAPVRFATLAISLHRASRAPDQSHPDLVLALTEARQSCLG
ncbi:hypothetical protein DRW48_13700 [Paracoccus suum]|uniref:Anti-sigma factor n=1 Tax=Paracoccus suum TaxID=2259340 RepID=A0A344PMJ4_9RHOB|nr:hypothetical protein [Paracoccus suum]AXC50599.1 hypothetical protein DRW48_13700 [Paracoccus suum]